VLSARVGIVRKLLQRSHLTQYTQVGLDKYLALYSLEDSDTCCIVVTVYSISAHSVGIKSREVRETEKSLLLESMLHSEKRLYAPVLYDLWHGNR
jgi:hypothetical protein